MKIHSISTSQYPSFDKSYTMHLKAPSVSNPYAMVPITEPLYILLKELFEEMNEIEEVKEDKYSTVILIR